MRKAKPTAVTLAQSSPKDTLKRGHRTASPVKETVKRGHQAQTKKPSDRTALFGVHALACSSQASLGAADVSKVLFDDDFDFLRQEVAYGDLMRRVGAVVDD